MDPVRDGLMLCTSDISVGDAAGPSGLTWEEVIVYLDDIIVLGTDYQDIIGALRKIFIRFRTHNLKFKPRKCQFFKSQVEFLGKLVSGSGIAISPD